MAKVKILFAFYPLHVHWNHGVALLSSVCKEFGISTDLYMLDDITKFMGYISDNNHDTVAFSCVTKHDFKKTIPFMAAAKYAGCRVLLGGTYLELGHPTPPVDFVCRGEGERLPEFICGRGSLLFEQKQYWWNLDALPLPDYDLFEGIPFDRDLPFLDGKRVLPYYSSRGCPNACSFCQTRFQGGKLRIRTQVEKDLTELKLRFDPDIFFLGDALTPYYSKKWRESWGKFEHPFVAYICPDIEPDVLNWMIDRGMQGCAFGIESGDEAYRNKVLNKLVLDRHIFETVEILRKRNIHYVPFYMSDTPRETFEVRQKTDNMRRELGGIPFTFKYENLMEA